MTPNTRVRTGWPPAARLRAELRRTTAALERDMRKLGHLQRLHRGRRRPPAVPFTWCVSVSVAPPGGRPGDPSTGGEVGL